MIEIRHPLRTERDAIGELVARSFEHPRATLPEVRAAVADDPDYADANSFVAVVEGGEIVGHLAVKESAVSLGEQMLPVARLGTVCTAPTARRKGVGRALIEVAAAQFASLGGILLNPAPEPYVQRFYESLGFVAAIRTRALFKVEQPAVPARAQGIIVRPAGPPDLAFLADCYRRHYLPQPGSLTRGDDWWRRRLAGQPLLWSTLTPELTVAERRGRPLAYAISAPDDDFRVWEWAGPPGEATLALLARLAAGSGQTFTVHLTRADPLWGQFTALHPVDVTPLRGPVMLRAGDESLLRATLAGLLARRGATLGGASQPTVTVGDATLTASWSHLLALAYDGRPLGPWLSQRLVRLEPSGVTARSAMQQVLPVRDAGRRPTDAY